MYCMVVLVLVFFISLSVNRVAIPNLDCQAMKAYSLHDSKKSSVEDRLPVVEPIKPPRPGNQYNKTAFIKAINAHDCLICLSKTILQYPS